MAFSTTVKTGETATVEYETSPGGGTFAELVFARDVPEIGEQGTFVNVTPLRSATQEFAAGGFETQEVEFVLFDVPGNTDHEAYITKARASETVLHKLSYPSGRVIDIDLVLNGAKVNAPVRDEGLTITVYAQQRGASSWGESA